MFSVSPAASSIVSLFVPVMRSIASRKASGVTAQLPIKHLESQAVKKTADAKMQSRTRGMVRAFRFIYLHSRFSWKRFFIHGIIRHSCCVNSCSSPRNQPICAIQNKIGIRTQRLDASVLALLRPVFFCSDNDYRNPVVSFCNSAILLMSVFSLHLLQTRKKRGII